MTTAPMPAAPPAAYGFPSREAPSFRWFVCALLFLATTINYMDRQVLGLLAPMLQKDIGWNDAQYAHIVIAFQSAYALGLLGVGYLIDRWGTKIGYAIAIAIWSIAAALHAGVRTVAGFGAARFLLGLGESGNFPSAIKAAAEWFDPSERALATGIFNSGSNFGAIVAPALIPPLADRYGWQAAFIALGVAGLIWLLLWLALYRRPAQQNLPAPADGSPAAPKHHPAPAANAGLLRLLTLRQTWGFIAISVAGQPVGWFFLYWLPKFFSEKYSLSISQLGLPLVVVYSMAFIGGILGGILPRAMLNSHWSLNASRKGALAVCAALMIPVAFATRAPSMWAATAMIGLGLAALQGWAANCYTVVSDLFAKSNVASVVGLGTFVGSIAGIGFAELAGIVLQSSQNYGLLFLIAGIVCPVGLFCLHLLVPRWERAPI